MEWCYLWHHLLHVVYGSLLEAKDVLQELRFKKYIGKSSEVF